jgi:F420-dependent oxidoreductase-like protein
MYMVALSVMIEGQDGLIWSRWKRLVSAAEDLGFAGLFRSDHFTNRDAPDKDSLEMIVSLTYAADRTRRIHFGPLVAPVSFRHPILFARQAAALDDLSGGRMILGLGAGWQEREHTHFGYDLGDIPTRMERYQEALEAVTRLLRSDEPVTFEGKHFQLREAILLPRPQRAGGPPILIGGNGPKRTLPLAARYADIWNCVFPTPSAFHELSSQLDEFLRKVGRKPGDVKRTAMLPVLFGHDMHQLESRAGGWLQRPEFAGKPLTEAIKAMQAQHGLLAGTPEMLIEQIKAYVDAGVEEIMLQWSDMDDIAGLQGFAESVLPHV